MSLILYYHPLASFCHKVLLALYENGTAFEGRVVDLGDPASSAEMLSLWPVGKFPVLHDKPRDQTVPETSIIIEYLQRHHAGPLRLIPDDPDLALQARLWDRFFDLYVNTSVSKIVTDRIRPGGRHDPHGVEDALAMLRIAYGILERHLDGKTWGIGQDFSLADCAAAPALFYADIVLPFSAEHPRCAAYFERLVERPAFQRTLREAQPYFSMFPLRDAIPPRFLGPAE